MGGRERGGKEAAGARKAKDEEEDERRERQYAASNVWKKELRDYEMRKHETREREREGTREREDGEEEAAYWENGKENGSGIMRGVKCLEKGIIRLQNYETRDEGKRAAGKVRGR